MKTAPDVPVSHLALMPLPYSRLVLFAVAVLVCGWLLLDGQGPVAVFH